MNVAFQLEDALDTQHFLNLVLHGHVVFEVQRRIRAERQAPIAFVKHDLFSKVITKSGVLLQTVQRFPGQFFHSIRFRRHF